MSWSRFAIAAAAVLSLAMPVMAQEELIGVPGPISFEGKTFDLTWSSHPSPTYYKQEYVPDGQAVESYVEMFMIDVLTTGETPESASAAMIAGLDQRKTGGDPVVNYAIIENTATGELVLDFLVSDTSSGEIIVEWNAYRYSPTADGGLTLFAISRRGYGDDGAKQFLSTLTNWRQASIQALATMDLPPIAIPD